GGDDSVGQALGVGGRGDEHEVVTAHVAGETGSVQQVLERRGEQRRRGPDDAVAGGEPVVVVEGLEVVEVGVEQCEVGTGTGQQVLQLPEDGDVAGQPREGRDVAQLAGTPQCAPDPGDQFGRVERLGDVVVGARFQPEELVRLLDASGQDDD